MAKMSNNKLLGSGEVVEKTAKIKMEDTVSIKLYRKDYPQGRVFEGAETVAMMKRKMWREKSFEFPEEKVIEVIKPVKKSSKSTMKITKLGDKK